MNITIIIITAILAIAGWVIPKQPSIFIIISVILLLILSAFLQILNENRINKENQKQRYVGVLNPNSSQLEGKDLKKKLEVGWSPQYSGLLLEHGKKMQEQMQGGANENSPYFSFLYDNSLIISEDNGHLKVSLLIRDQTGTVVARIIENEWQVSHPPGIFDRNYTNDTLEIINNSGEVFLQIRLLADRVQLNGVFYNSEGYGIEVYPHPETKGKWRMHILAPETKRRYELKPLFKYPSELHFGEYLTTDNS
jgi:hypothetical protein